MRFDTPIYFQRVTPGKYNPNTGNYEKDTVIERVRYASVTSSNTETLKIVYGTLKQESLTVRLQSVYTEPFDQIRIGTKTYHVDFSRVLKFKHTFIVSETQNG